MILDTNALSDIFKENETIRTHIEKADQLYVPVIVLGEYLFGIKGSTKSHELSSLLSGFMNEVQELIISNKTATHYAEIRWELKNNGTPIPENDIWIAALAREFSIPLLSRDSHFDFVTKITRLTW